MRIVVQVKDREEERNFRDINYLKRITSSWKEEKQENA